MQILQVLYLNEFTHLDEVLDEGSLSVHHVDCGRGALCRCMQGWRVLVVPDGDGDAAADDEVQAVLPYVVLQGCNSIDILGFSTVMKD